MPPMNQKNMAISPAGADLGLGDQLNMQAQESEDELKKRAMAKNSQSNLLGAALSPAAASLGLGSPLGGGGLG
jgi:hypothetical protein